MELILNNPYAAPGADLSALINDGKTYTPKVLAVNGRIGRVRYLVYTVWLSFLLLFITGLAMGLLSLINPILGLLGMILYIPVMAVSFIMAIRRLNDLEYSGWLSVLMIVPLVNLILSLWLLFGRGTDGSNRYGPAPGPNSTAVIVGAWIVPVLAIVMGIGAAFAIPYYQDYVVKTQMQQLNSSPVEEAQQ